MDPKMVDQAFDEMKCMSRISFTVFDTVKVFLELPMSRQREILRTLGLDHHINKSLPSPWCYVPAFSAAKEQGLAQRLIEAIHGAAHADHSGERLTSDYSGIDPSAEQLPPQLSEMQKSALVIAEKRLRNSRKTFAAHLLRTQFPEAFRR